MSVLPRTKAGPLTIIAPPVMQSASPGILSISFDAVGRRVYIMLTNGTTQSYGIPARMIEQYIFDSPDPVSGFNAVRASLTA